jgi:hypothetical protein
VVGVCVQNPCPRAHLYFPDGNDGGRSVKCHKVGSRGPCPLGELVVFEKYSGKSYRGECGCSPGYNQNYWPPTHMCYEWYSQGPCGDSFLFRFNKDTGKTECVCDEDEGYVFWNETNKCYRVYTKGPCPSHAWLIPSEDKMPPPLTSSTALQLAKKKMKEVFCECRTSYHFDPESYTCKRSSAFGLPELLYGAAADQTTWAHLSLMDRLRRRQMISQKPQEVAWTRGVFVSGGKTSTTTRRPKPKITKSPARDYSWLATKAVQRESPTDQTPVPPASAGWGAKALPRVARILGSGGNSGGISVAGVVDGGGMRIPTVRTRILARRRVLRN